MKTAITKVISLITSNRGGSHGGPKPPEILKITLSVMDLDGVHGYTVNHIIRSYYIKNTTESIRDNTSIYNFVKLMYLYNPPRPYIEISKFRFAKDHMYCVNTEKGMAVASVYGTSDTEKLLYNE